MRRTVQVATSALAALVVVIVALVAPGLTVNSETCTALTAVFPLILLVATQQRRDLNMNLRRLKLIRRTLFCIVVACLLGLPLSVIGVATKGLEGVWAAAICAAAAVAGVGLGLVIIALHASMEVEEDKAPLRTDARPRMTHFRARAAALRRLRGL